MSFLPKIPKIPKIPTGNLRRALGVPSTGKNFVQRIVAMAPLHLKDQLESYLSEVWESRILPIGGSDFVKLMDEHPVLTRLIQEEIQKVSNGFLEFDVIKNTAKNIAMVNPNSRVLDLVDGFTYFNEVAKLMPETFRKFIVKNMAEYWVRRPHKDRGSDHMIALLKSRCIQVLIRKQREVLKRAEEGIKEQVASGVTEKEIEGNKERNCATVALAFAQGIDTVMDSDFWSDKDGKLIGIKKHRSIDIGKECGVGFFPDGKEQGIPPVAPPQGAVDNGGIKEGESPIAFAPLPPPQVPGGIPRQIPNVAMWHGQQAEEAIEKPLPEVRNYSLPLGYRAPPAPPPPGSPPISFSKYHIPLTSTVSFPKSKLSYVPEQTGNSRRKTRRKLKKNKRKTRSRKFHR